MQNEADGVTVSSTATTRILAGIDIGTLTCRLLIAEFSPSKGLVNCDRIGAFFGSGKVSIGIVCCVLMPWSGWLPR